MAVDELITKLRKYDPELVVKLRVYDTNWEESYLTAVAVKLCTDAEFLKTQCIGEKSIVMLVAD